MLSSLDLAEEAIIVDPVHRVLREEIDGVVYDKNEPGVMVSFTMLDGEVYFLSFADLWER